MVTQAFTDDSKLAGGPAVGGTAMIADFCPDDCPGGCQHGCHISTYYGRRTIVQRHEDGDWYGRDLGPWP